MLDKDIGQGSVKVRKILELRFPYSDTNYSQIIFSVTQGPL